MALLLPSDIIDHPLPFTLRQALRFGYAVDVREAATPWAADVAELAHRTRTGATLEDVRLRLCLLLLLLLLLCMIETLPLLR
jgi:hypothetical protein